MAKRKNNNSFLKIVYFDEKSVLDYLDTIKEGRYEEVTKQVINKATKIAAEINSKNEGKISIPYLVKSIFNANGNVSVSRDKSSVLNTTLTNTILTTFLEKENVKNTEKLEGYKLNIEKKSFTYLKIFTPIIRAFKIDQETDNIPVDLSILDEVMESAKGYYEMIGTKRDKEVVMRFNLSGLRNNYRLNDLTKMNITLYGVCVGTCKKSDLWIENELGIDVQQDVNVLAEQVTDINSNDQEELKLYDILLAGVEKNAD
ncbi:hypothetical protein CJ480_15150 [Bacillus subtilis]|uniref:DUF6414 family protein n=1 Tax=Bacillus subtilis TaxID=1423 RepID=UPI000E762711|nr:DUF6414 family protein [Bacillus subtilis]RJS53056.1 hypothetical protein CJ480_15150 [Bacillus subtilis]